MFDDFTLWVGFKIWSCLCVCWVWAFWLIFVVCINILVGSVCICFSIPFLCGLRTMKRIRETTWFGYTFDFAYLRKMLVMAFRQFGEQKHILYRREVAVLLYYEDKCFVILWRQMFKLLEIDGLGKAAILWYFFLVWVVNVFKEYILVIGSAILKKFWQ